MDISRVDQLHRHLQENPSYHRQDSFACGTAGCAAGWTIALEHGAHVSDWLNDIVYSEAVSECIPPVGGRWDFRLSADDYIIAADDQARYARMLLDFRAEEACAVFYQTTHAINPNTDTVALLGALVHREKDELSQVDIDILIKYDLPLMPPTEGD